MTGINFAFTRLAVNNGAKVVIVDLKLTDEAEEFVVAHPNAVKFVKTDVTKWQQLKHSIVFAQTHFGSVPDVYIAGAGIFDPPGYNFWDDSEEERYKEIDIDVSHVIKLTRMAMRALVSRNKKGVVLSIASEAGLSGVYNVPLYCACKHAVVGFTKSMAPADLLEGVKIVTICPGSVSLPKQRLSATDCSRSIVDTPLFDPEKRETMQANLLTAMKPDDVARVMLSLVEEGKYLGGTVYELSSLEEGRVMPLWGAEPSKTAVGMAQAHSPEYVEHVPFFQKLRERMVEERKVEWP